MTHNTGAVYREGKKKKQTQEGLVFLKCMALYIDEASAFQYVWSPYLSPPLHCFFVLEMEAPEDAPVLIWWKAGTLHLLSVKFVGIIRTSV